MPLQGTNQQQVQGEFQQWMGFLHALQGDERLDALFDRLQVPGPGLLTNCCFGGPDLRTLFVAQGVPGSILAFEGLATPGLAVNPWPVPTVG